MTAIRDLFDPSRPIDRRIEKVITYDAANEDLLRREIQEYVVTKSIEDHFDSLLGWLETGLNPNAGVDTAVWVSGFYGSGKSSFTKYLGFALDPTRTINDTPFYKWLQNQLQSKPLRQRLATTAQKFPATVIMLDLASEQLAGASMAEISTVLYAKVMQWAGYSRDAKVAHLELMLEKDGRLAEFKDRISQLSGGTSWDEIKNQPLAIKALASQAAAEFYPTLFPNSEAFNNIRLEDQLTEMNRVSGMLDLIKRKTGKQRVIFILDEVGQYVAPRDDLILNLDGLAKNIKNLGGGEAWIIATAQQTLTEDDPRALTNTDKLFKLKDRFPLSIDLEASDIKEICYRRLLGKSPQGETIINGLFDGYGAQLRHAVELEGTQYYRAELDRDSFRRLYPFLPHHFNILLQLLARLARTRGGVGLRSAIKVVQDVLVDTGRAHGGANRLADAPVGSLATTVTLFDTLRSDIQKPFPHIINGVARVEEVFGAGTLSAGVAKSIGVLQILEDFPVSRKNVAALMHPTVDAPALHDRVSQEVDNLLDEPAVPLSEVDGGLRFMSDTVLDLERARLNIQPRVADTRSLYNDALREIFQPAPTVRLRGTRRVGTGFKIYTGEVPVSLSGDREPIQTLIDLVSQSDFDPKKAERITESQQRTHRNTVFLLAVEPPDIDEMLMEIHRCREIYRQHRNQVSGKDEEDYLRAQDQRAQKLEKDLVQQIKKAMCAGALIFRARPRSVSELGEDIVSAIKNHLETVAKEVFEKYAEAPVQVDSVTAERFLKTEPLDAVTSANDPLGLVRAGGGASVIDIQHRAIVSIRDYLERQGQVDGRRLLDEFFAPPYGWFKDTIRYIIAAMLAAGTVKLRISGEDITVRGETAINSLKNTNGFNKIGIALRDAPMDPDKLLQARERLLTLTGEEILPLEEDISNCVMRYFPDFQHQYGPLAIQLDNLDLQGGDRARSIQDHLAEILKGDASDAANRLGGEQCPLYDDLRWARSVKAAFDNGIGDIIREGRHLLTEIPKLPPVGIPGKLATETDPRRQALAELIEREDFFNYLTDMQNHITEISGTVKQIALDFVEEQREDLESEKNRVKNRPEWISLASHHRDRLADQLDQLTVDAPATLQGIQQVINDGYLFTSEIKRIEADIKGRAENPERGIASGTDPIQIGDGKAGFTRPLVTVAIPSMIQTPEALDNLIQALESYRNQLASGIPIRITRQKTI